VTTAASVNASQMALAAIGLGHLTNDASVRAARAERASEHLIPAVLLPFENDLSIDEANFRKHLRDVAAVEGLSAITINAHSTEVASCTFEEQRRVLEIAQDEIGGRLPLGNGNWADGSLEAARIARTDRFVAELAAMPVLDPRSPREIMDDLNAL